MTTDPKSTSPDALAPFFAQLSAMLLGRQDAAAVEEALGPSSSGTDKLAFYRELMVRNAHKWIREIFPALKPTLVRVDPELWTRVVTDFVREFPPRHGNPNRVGAPLPQYLQRLAARGEVPAIAAELADYQWLQYLCSVADVRDDDDGWERHLFVRQYVHPVAGYVSAVVRGDSPPFPDPRPTIVLVYRGRKRGAVQWLHPTPQQIGAIALRQGLPLPPELAAVGSAEAFADAELELEAMGLLARRAPESQTDLQEAK